VEGARAFGLEMDAGQWEAVRKVTSAGQSIPAIDRIVLRAQEIAGRKELRFFHWELLFPEIFFDADGKRKAESGFDAVVGNPPYVRQEHLRPIKGYLAGRYETYSGTADIYVYFYEQAMRLLRPGAHVAYITANKWLRAGYGEPMGAFLSSKAETREIVDFGHAPIFKDADTFLAIAVLRNAPRRESETARVTQFPRASLGTVTLNEYTRLRGVSVPVRRFGAAAWSLEDAEIDGLMETIRRAGVPLKDYLGASPYYGIKTGFNEAYFIDTPTKDKLIAADPQCAEIIKPYLREQDIKRWSPEWAGWWVILLKSSENYEWAWANAENPESVFATTYPSLYVHMKTHATNLQRREDRGRYWWELRSCSYYSQFRKPKLVYQVIQFHSAYGYEPTETYINDKGFMLPTDATWLYAALNSPLLWWFGWRYFQHMKDEALNPAGEKMVDLPIARPTDEIRAESETAVKRLIALTQNRRAALRDLLDWLKVEYGVEKPGQTLEAFKGVSEEAFIEETRKRRPKQAAKLSPAGLRALRETHAEYAALVGGIDRETGTLERRLSDLVNTAYGLSEAEIDLLWKTAPPRMPLQQNPQTALE
jgi:hypothetical protein